MYSERKVVLRPLGLILQGHRGGGDRFHVGGVDRGRAGGRRRGDDAAERDTGPHREDGERACGPAEHLRDHATTLPRFKGLPMLSPTPLLLRLPLAAVGDQRRGVERLAVLGGEATLARWGLRQMFSQLTKQALLAALHFQDELGDRGVGDRFEGVADAAALAGVDPCRPGSTSIWPLQGERPGRGVRGWRSAGRPGLPAAGRAAG